MKERIKKLRKALDLTQQEFADRLGISRGNIATYETRDGSPGSSVITLICREFNVNEEWLRTGSGEMFLELSRDDEIAAFIGNVLHSEPDSFRKRFIAVLSRLDVSDWEVLERMAAGMVQKQTANQGAPIIPPGYSSREELEAEADEFAAIAREQFLSEKIPGYQAFSANGSAGPGGGKPA